MPTIEKRNNSYRITVSAGYDLQGKQIKKRMTWTPSEGMTAKQIEKEVKRQAVLFEERCQSGQFIDSSVRFAEFSEIWMNDYAIPQLRPSTVAGYRKELERLNEHLGHIQLKKLQPHNIAACYKAIAEQGKRSRPKHQLKIDIKPLLKEQKITHKKFAEVAGIGFRTFNTVVAKKPIDEKTAEAVSKTINLPMNVLFEVVPGKDGKLSNNTLLHLHRLLSSILEKAVKWQVLLYNPCRRVEAPKLERKEAVYLDEVQAQELVNRLQSEPLQYRTIITLLLYTGMRRGELCGLEWPDIDFTNFLIDISRSSLYLSDRGVFDDDTKTNSSKRVIKVPTVAVEMLKEHKRQQITERLKLGDKWVESNKVFTQWNGKPIHPDTITGWFARFIKRHDLPPIHLHSLRHTNATLLIAAGTDLRTVSKRLGHSNMTTTANIYTHAIKSADERASELLGDILNPTRQKRA